MIEVIASSLQDAKVAFEGGADRLELVSALSEGGLTPSFGLMEEILKLPIETAVMLRPSSASFCYREDEWQVMRRDLEQMERMGVKRVVVGALDAKGDVDVFHLKRLFQDIDLKATFHRAIDASRDLLSSLKAIESLKNFTHVLTSGGEGKAWDHRELLQQMIQQASLRVIVGSGVNLDNVSLFREFLKGDYDLHVGTAVRRGGIHGSVALDLVQEFVQKGR